MWLIHIEKPVKNTWVSEGRLEGWVTRWYYRIMYILWAGVYKNKQLEFIIYVCVCLEKSWEQ